MKDRRWLRRGEAALLVALTLAALVYVFARGDETGHVRIPYEVAERAEREDRPIRIGWTAWADAELVSHMAARLLRDMGYEVELVMADIGIQYEGIATGDLDVMMMAWLPLTHASYWEKVHGRVIDLGPIYTRARLGWVVPDYVPEEKLDSLVDLARPEVAMRLGHTIQGIDPGSGLMQASERALTAYGLEDYELGTSSGAAMTAALERAVRREEWIVLTAWRPHWMFARWDLRFLDDPGRVLGARERIHILCRRGFYTELPVEVTEVLARFFLPLEELEAAMLDASERGVEAAVEAYLAAHPGRVHYWLTGDVTAP